MEVDRIAGGEVGAGGWQVSGWFAMSRAMFEHPIFTGRPERVAAWAWIVAMAAWSDTKQDANGKTVAVKRGQLLTSYKQMSKATGVGIQSLRTLIDRLQTDNAIDTDTNTGRLLITVRNYEKYQSGGTEPTRAETREQHGSNTGATHKRTIEQLTTIPVGAQSAPIDPAKVVFDAGVRVLGQAGKSDGQARGIVGMWRKQYGDEAVIAALGKAQREGAVDPVSYCEGVFRQQRKSANQTERPGFVAQGAFGNIPERN